MTDRLIALAVVSLLMLSIGVAAYVLRRVLQRSESEYRRVREAGGRAQRRP
jgi:hypothetical protein